MQNSAQKNEKTSKIDKRYAKRAGKSLDWHSDFLPTQQLFITVSGSFYQMYIDVKCNVIFASTESK